MSPTPATPPQSLFPPVRPVNPVEQDFLHSFDGPFGELLAELPDGRPKSLVRTKLDEAIMWAFQAFREDVS